MSTELDRRLLIVEEDPDLRSRLRAAAVDDPRFTAVVDVADADAATTIAADPTFDAVILGHSRDSGLERVRSLRSLLPSATIVLHTSDDLGVFALALLAGADDVLAKGEALRFVLDAAAPSAEPFDPGIIDLREETSAAETIDLRDEVPGAAHELLGYAFGPPVDPFTALCSCGWRSAPAASPTDARAALEAHLHASSTDEPRTTAGERGNAGRRPTQ